MISFKDFQLNEVWLNRIGQGSKEGSVTTDKKYPSPTTFKKDAEKVGEVGDLHLYKSGTTHFTWGPQDNLIHHVIHSVEQTKTPEGNTRLKYLSAHGRSNSSVRMGQVYSSMVKDHGYEFAATGHSPGAKKMWDRFREDPELKVSHEDGTEVGKNENVYASQDEKDKNIRKNVGMKGIVLSKRQEDTYGD